MGASKSKDKQGGQRQGSYEVQNYYDEVIQYEQCCGIQRKRTVKKQLIWEDNFNRNCEDLLMYYDWVHDLQEAVKTYGRKLPRKKFLDEVNALRIINKIEAPRQNEILLSPSQIDQFKVNLKNSVLLSYGQALKPARQKQASKIESVIYSTTSKAQKNLNMSSSFNNPPSLRKKSDLGHDQIRKDSILKQRQKTLRQSYSKSGLRESIMSFVDDTMSTLFRGHEKQISKQSAHCLQVFLKFSLILEKHLNSKENIICIIIESFTNYIYKKYSIFQNSQSSKMESEFSEMSERQKQVLYLDEIEHKVKKIIKKERFKQLQKRKSLTSQQVEDLTTDIKIFLVLLRQIIQDYYKTNQFSYEFVSLASESQQTERSMSENFNINTLITNQDNILILVTAILFKNDKFYSHIMSIFKKFHSQREENFKKIIQGLKDRPPEYFEIKPDYCLNDQTIQKFKGNQDKNSKILNQLQTKVEQIARSNSKQENSPERKASEKQIKDLKNRYLSPPYQKCAETLQKIIKSKTASSKMKVIMQCSEKITQSVAEFYNANQIELKNHVLDADQVLSIFCYILATNALENIHANLFMIQHFATQNQMISVTGYYYSVLTIAVEQLENMYSSTMADMESMANSEFSEKQASIKSKKGNKSINKSILKQGNRDKVKRSFKKAE